MTVMASAAVPHPDEELTKVSSLGDRMFMKYPLSMTQGQDVGESPLNVHPELLKLQSMNLACSPGQQATTKGRDKAAGPRIQVESSENATAGLGHAPDSSKELSSDPAGSVSSPGHRLAT